jgi:hypothetical protein
MRILQALFLVVIVLYLYKWSKEFIMRPFLLALGIASAIFLLSSCAVTTVSTTGPAYSPGYNSVGFYSTPSWGYGGYYPGGVGTFGRFGYPGRFGVGFGGPGFGLGPW